MTQEHAYDLAFNDSIPEDNSVADFSVAVAVDLDASSVRFMTGRYSPKNLGSQVVLFPIYADPIHTVMEIYKRLNIKLEALSWSPGQPSIIKLRDLGYNEPKAGYLGKSETMMVLTATATRYAK